MGIEIKYKSQNLLNQLAKLTLQAVVIGVLLQSHAVFANVVASIEDKNFKPVSEDFRKVICNQIDCNLINDNKCVFKFKTIMTPFEKNPAIRFVTTENACNWGAYVGPIWLFDEQAPYNLLLKTTGYSLNFVTNTQQNIVILQAGSASHTYTEQWEWVDGKFKKSHES